MLALARVRYCAPLRGGLESSSYDYKIVYVHFLFSRRFPLHLCSFSLVPVMSCKRESESVCNAGNCFLALETLKNDVKILKEENRELQSKNLLLSEEIKDVKEQFDSRLELDLKSIDELGKITKELNRANAHSAEQSQQLEEANRKLAAAQSENAQLKERVKVLEAAVGIRKEEADVPDPKSRMPSSRRREFIRYS